MQSVHLVWGLYKAECSYLRAALTWVLGVLRGAGGSQQGGVRVTVNDDHVIVAVTTDNE